MVARCFIASVACDMNGEEEDFSGQITEFQNTRE
jgi:hypothetical protein